MDKITNHTCYSKELMLEAYKEFLWVKHRFRNMVSLAVAFMLVFVSANALIGGKPLNLNLAAYIMVALGLVWTVFWGYTSVARRTYDGMLQNGMSLDVSYSFSSDGFAVKTAEDSFTIKWQQCLFAIQTESLCLIVVKKKFYAVDLNGFTSGSPQKLAELLSKNTKIRAKRKF